MYSDDEDKKKSLGRVIGDECVILVEIQRNDPEVCIVTIVSKGKAFGTWSKQVQACIDRWIKAVT